METDILMFALGDRNWSGSGREVEALKVVTVRPVRCIVSIRRHGGGVEMWILDEGMTGLIRRELVQPYRRLGWDEGLDS